MCRVAIIIFLHRYRLSMSFKKQPPKRLTICIDNPTSSSWSSLGAQCSLTTDLVLIAMSGTLETLVIALLQICAVCLVESYGYFMEIPYKIMMEHVQYNWWMCMDFPLHKAAPGGIMFRWYIENRRWHPWLSDGPFWITVTMNLKAVTGGQLWNCPTKLWDHQSILAGSEYIPKFQSPEFSKKLGSDRTHFWDTNHPWLPPAWAIGLTMARCIFIMYFFWYLSHPLCVARDPNFGLAATRFTEVLIIKSGEEYQSPSWLDCYNIRFDSHTSSGSFKVSGKPHMCFENRSGFLASGTFGISTTPKEQS